LRPDRLLGDRGWDQHQRDGAVSRPVSRELPARRCRDRPRHPRPLLLAAHAAPAGGDPRPNRSAPLPRRAPRRLLAAVVGRGGGPRARRAAAGSRHRASQPGSARRYEEAGLMTSRRLEERRIAFQRYKDDVKREGKPFYPYAMFHDTVMSLVVVSVIVGLAFVWHYTDLLGPSLAAKADPGTTSFVPRPDWYFYFLFYLLRIFKWPNSVILGTVGIPTILLIVL